MQPSKALCAGRHRISYLWLRGSRSWRLQGFCWQQQRGCPEYPGTPGMEQCSDSSWMQPGLLALPELRASCSSAFLLLTAPPSSWAHFTWQWETTAGFASWVPLHRGLKDSEFSQGMERMAGKQPDTPFSGSWGIESCRGWVTRGQSFSCKMQHTTDQGSAQPQAGQKISEFMLLSLSQIDTEVLTALQMTFVTAMLHLLRKQNSGAIGLRANGRIYPCTSQRCCTACLG